MTIWRVHRLWTDDRWPRDDDLKVKDVFVDVEKTVIFKDLLDYGINVGELPVFASDQYIMGGVMGIGMLGEKWGVFIDASALRKGYPGSEDKYIGLVHELAHFRGYLTGDSHVETLPTMKHWTRSHSEKDAVRWSARQARLMGWSEEKTKAFFAYRYQRHKKEIIEAIQREGEIGHRLHPQQETLALLQRRPGVRVRGHRRRPAR